MKEEIDVLERTHLLVYIGILKDLGIEERISGVSPEIDGIRYLEKERDVPLFKEILEKAQIQGHFSWLKVVEVEGELKLINKELAENCQSESELEAGSSWILTSILIDDQNRKVLCWSEKGINELSSIIRTDEAKEHQKLTTIDPARLLKK